MTCSFLKQSLSKPCWARRACRSIVALPVDPSEAMWTQLALTVCWTKSLNTLQCIAKHSIAEQTSVVPLETVCIATVPKTSEHSQKHPSDNTSQPPPRPSLGFALGGALPLSQASGTSQLHGLRWALRRWSQHPCGQPWNITSHECVVILSWH